MPSELPSSNTPSPKRPYPPSVKLFLFVLGTGGTVFGLSQFVRSQISDEAHMSATLLMICGIVRLQKPLPQHKRIHRKNKPPAIRKTLFYQNLQKALRLLLTWPCPAQTISLLHSKILSIPTNSKGPSSKRCLCVQVFLMLIECLIPGDLNSLKTNDIGSMQGPKILTKTSTMASSLLKQP